MFCGAWEGSCGIECLHEVVQVCEALERGVDIACGVVLEARCAAVPFQFGGGWWRV